MQFSINAGKLAEALAVVTRALSARTTNPVLDGILIEAGSTHVQLTCSDERITIITRVDAQISDPGRGVAPGKLFTAMVRRMGDGELSVSMNANYQFRLTSGASRMNLAGQDAELFPLPGIVDDGQEITLPQSMLKDMIAKTDFAIAQDDIREVLTGCLFEVEGGDATMVALDGFRMALIKYKCSDVTGSMSAIIPGRAVGDIGRLLKDGEEDFCTLSFEHNRLHINMMGTDIYVVLVSGEFIDYRRILPTQFATRVVAELEPMRHCVDRAALIARDGNNLVRFTIESGKMLIESSSETGDVHEELDIEQEGADLSITFNVRYMLDVVRIIEGDKLEMNFNTNVTPCIITPVNNRDYQHLVLPVRTQA